MDTTKSEPLPISDGAKESLLKAYDFACRFRSVYGKFLLRVEEVPTPTTMDEAFARKPVFVYDAGNRFMGKEVELRSMGFDTNGMGHVLAWALIHSVESLEEEMRKFNVEIPNGIE